MSDYAINLLNAIAAGDKDVMNSSFSDALNAKIADAIDAKKIEVAQGIYGGQVETEDSIDSGEEVDIDTTETSDENGTEEV
jgi:hypothetical protein